MAKSREVADEALLVPACIALRAEKRFALIIVHAVDGEPVIMKKLGNFRTDEAGRASDQTDVAHYVASRLYVPGSVLRPIKALLNEIWRAFANSKWLLEVK